MIVLDPHGTLVRVALLCLAAGALWSAAAALAIYLGATQFKPKVPAGSIWAEWRRRRVLWVMSLLVGLVGACWTAEVVGRSAGLVDLYWITRQDELFWIARLGGLSGFLLVLFVLVLTGAVARRRTRPGRSAS